LIAHAGPCERSFVTYNERMRIVMTQTLILLLAFSVPALSYAQDEPVSAVASEVAEDDGTALDTGDGMASVTDPAVGQEESAGEELQPAGEILEEAQCFNVINQAPYSVFGSFVSDIYTTADGVKARHRSNFRLQISEQAEFCTYGPFFEGRRLELTLRTLIPIFACQTKVDQDIVIYGRRNPEGGTKTWATCR